MKSQHCPCMRKLSAVQLRGVGQGVRGEASGCLCRWFPSGHSLTSVSPPSHWAPLKPAPAPCRGSTSASPVLRPAGNVCGGLAPPQTPASGAAARLGKVGAGGQACWPCFPAVQTATTVAADSHGHASTLPLGPGPRVQPSVPAHSSGSSHLRCLCSSRPPRGALRSLLPLCARGPGARCALSLLPRPHPRARLPISRTPSRGERGTLVDFGCSGCCGSAGRAGASQAAIPLAPLGVLWSVSVWCACFHPFTLSVSFCFKNDSKQYSWTCKVCPEGVQPCPMKNRGIYRRRRSYCED